MLWEARCAFKNTSSCTNIHFFKWSFASEGWVLKIFPGYCLWKVMYMGIVADNRISVLFLRLCFLLLLALLKNLCNSLMQPLAAIIRSEKAWETQSRLEENLMLKIGKSIEQPDPVRCPCPWQGGWTRCPLKIPSNPACFVIVKF